MQFLYVSTYTLTVMKQHAKSQSATGSETALNTIYLLGFVCLCEIAKREEVLPHGYL